MTVSEIPDTARLKRHLRKNRAGILIFLSSFQRAVFRVFDNSQKVPLEDTVYFLFFPPLYFRGGQMSCCPAACTTVPTLG